ncbi:hypothetical protein ES708_26506 [subsurface metagenome]
MRYGGHYKSYGPQYVRGIIEGNGFPPDGNMWITYSMNKEDIWVAKVAVPIEEKASEHVDVIFDDLPGEQELDKWNTYSSLWAPVTVKKVNNEKLLVLKDKDPCDYAKAERIFPESKILTARFTIVPKQNHFGMLHIEFQDRNGTPAVRLVFDRDSMLKVKSGYRMKTIASYYPDTAYTIEVDLNVNTRLYDVYVNGIKGSTQFFFAPVHALERIVFRTGEVRRFPNADTPAFQDFDIPDAGIPGKEAIYYIKSVTTDSQ